MVVPAGRRTTRSAGGRSSRNSAGFGGGNGSGTGHGSGHGSGKRSRGNGRHSRGGGEQDHYNFAGSNKKGPAKKWIQVMRPPAIGVGFEVPVWVGVDVLTEVERNKYLPEVVVKEVVSVDAAVAKEEGGEGAAAASAAAVDQSQSALPTSPMDTTPQTPALAVSFLLTPKQPSLTAGENWSGPEESEGNDGDNGDQGVEEEVEPPAKRVKISQSPGTALLQQQLPQQQLEQEPEPEQWEHQPPL
jgi:hypothetical protein